MRRFIVSGRLSAGAKLALSPEEGRHATRVLRLETGAQILLADGKGNEAEAVITAIGPDGVSVEVISVRNAAPQTKLEILQAALKGPKMDWLVEKLTEMGVSAIHPVVSQRTVATGDRGERWQRIAHSAMKQSGNLLEPEILPLATLTESLARFDSCAKLLLQPGAGRGLAELVRENRSSCRIVLAIGPEGGFSGEEESLLLQAGFLPAALSLQVLRGETAALAALAIAAHSIDF